MGNDLDGMRRGVCLGNMSLRYLLYFTSSMSFAHGLKYLIPYGIILYISQVSFKQLEISWTLLRSF